MNDLLISVPIEVSATDNNRVAAFYTAILRSTEETFLQYSEERLDEEYFSNRLREMLVFLQSPQDQVNWQLRKDFDVYDEAFIDRVDEALAASLSCGRAIECPILGGDRRLLSPELRSNPEESQ